MKKKTKQITLYKFALAQGTHQAVEIVDFERLGRVRAQRLYHHRADGDVGHEMAVHHVDMHPIGPFGLDRAAFGAEVGEISRQDRRRDLDGTREGHGGPNLCLRAVSPGFTP